MPNEATQSRMEIIEFLRGFAALSVAWFHFTNGEDLISSGWLKSTGSYGWLGVEVFFVISGFIIPFSMFKSGFSFPRHVKTFLLKRILRLEPPYIIAILLSLMLTFISAATPWFKGQQPDITLTQILLHLGYLNAFFDYGWLNPVFWTLAIEFQFYICISILFPLISHNSTYVRMLSLLAMCAIAFIIENNAFVFEYMTLFALGIVTFWKFCGLIKNRDYLIAIFLFSCASAFSLDIPSAIAGLSTALLIGYITIKRSAVFTFFGATSYSLYLLHVPIGGRIVNLGKRLPDMLAVDLLVLFTALVCSLIAAYVMYKFIERPAQGWSSALKYTPVKCSPSKDVL